MEDNNTLEEIKETESPVYHKRPEMPAPKPKKKKNRSFFYGVMTGIWISVILFAAGNLIGWLVGSSSLMGSDIPALSNNKSEEVVTTQTTRKIKAIEDVIHKFYLEDTDAQTLEDGLYSGMVASLGDPYSDYYSQEELEEMEQIFDAVDTVKLCIPVFLDMIMTMTVKKENMLKGAKGGFTNATDVADYLVKKGMPFRDAHEVCGKLVFYSISKDKNLDDLTIDEFKEFSDIIEEDVYDAISMDTCVNGRTVIGGPAKATVENAIKIAEAYLKN